ncbi:hypothetical protein Tco_1203645 [Tanacetum coccineum]
MNMGQDRNIQIVRGNGRNQFGQYIVQNVGNQVVQNPGSRAEVRPRRRDAAYLQTQLLIAQKEEAKIQLQAEEYDLMSVAADINEIEEVNANCILMANSQQASSAGTQTDKASILSLGNGSSGPIPESHLVQQNDSDVITAAPSVEQSGGIVEQHSATVEEIHAYYQSLYKNLALRSRIFPHALPPSTKSYEKAKAASHPPKPIIPPSKSDCKLSDRKAGSKGISGTSVADSIADRLTRPTAYKFKTDCSIIPVWGRGSVNMIKMSVILWNAEERDVVPPGPSTVLNLEILIVVSLWTSGLENGEHRDLILRNRGIACHVPEKTCQEGERVMNQVKANNRKEQKIGGFDSEMEHHNVINIMRLLQDDDMEEIQVANMVGLQTIRELEDRFVKKFCMTILKLQEIVNDYDQNKKKKKKKKQQQPIRSLSKKESKHVTWTSVTDDELTEADIKQMEADDQAIQTILLGLPEDIYAAVDSCETTQEIWLHVQQMMKGSDIGAQEKKAKLFNKWERFTSIDGESIESYYHRFSKIMNELKRNKYFPEKIASNLKFLNNLQPEWKRHITIVCQTKDLHYVDYTQLYDFLKMNQEEVNELRAKRLAKTHDPLALMAHSHNSYNYPVIHSDQPSPSSYMQQPLPNNNYNPQPSFNPNYVQQTMINLDNISDPTIAMNMALALIAKAFKLSTPTNNNKRISSNPRNRQIAQPSMNMGQDRHIQNVRGNGGNQFGQIPHPNGNQNGTGNVIAARAEGTGYGYNDNQISSNRIGIQICNDPIYDSDGSAEVHCDNGYNNDDIFNMFTQEDQYYELREPIPESHLVQQNDSDVITAAPSVEQSCGIVEQHFATVEEIHAYYQSLYKNLAVEVKKVNMVNRNMKVTNAEWTTELARCKNQEIFFEISQEKYNKLERCYQKSVYQEQCLTKKINALI